MATRQRNLIFCGLLTAYSIVNNATAKPFCPSQNFNVFLNTYQNSSEVQTQFTKNPLIWRSYTDSYEKPTITFKKRNMIEWPIILTEKQQASQNLTQKTNKVSNTVQKVLIGSKNSDEYMVKYYFYKTHDCWQLRRVDDLSLNN